MSRLRCRLVAVLVDIVGVERMPRPLADHCTRCPECLAEAARSARLRAGLRALRSSRFSAPTALHGNVMVQVRGVGQSLQSPIDVPVPIGRVVAAGAGAAAIAAVGALLILRRRATVAAG